MLVDALAVALVVPEDEEELALDALCALPSALDRFAVRAPLAPDRAVAEMPVPLEHEVGLFLVREDEKVMSAHYNELAVNMSSGKGKTYSEKTTTGIAVTHYLQSSILTICEVERRQGNIGQAEFAESLGSNGWAEGDVEVGAGVGSQSEQIRHGGLGVVEGNVNGEGICV